MGIMQIFYGRPSYTIHNDNVSVFITVQGGHLVAQYRHGKRSINPFFIAPWWDEALLKDTDEIMNVLRGDFFCFPFGGTGEPFKGKKYPIHGETANRSWDFGSVSEAGNEKHISLTMDLDYDRGSVEKLISLSEGEPVVYNTHIIRGFEGKMPLGHHPTLQLPEKEGSGIIDFSNPVLGYTPPVPFEEAKMGGYSLLKPGTEITDRAGVPNVFGGCVDITRYPLPMGYEDLALFLSDNEKEFVFTSVSVPEEGYLYFQLKNPRVLAQTLFWMSNGGRHYQPWNGRVRAVLGVEEITSFFHYGISKSSENNFLQEKGFKTCFNIEGKLPAEIKLIMGLIPIERNFKGVADIVKKSESMITIIGKGDEKIDVPCRVDFLLN